MEIQEILLKYWWALYLGLGFILACVSHLTSFQIGVAGKNSINPVDTFINTWLLWIVFLVVVLVATLFRGLEIGVGHFLSLISPKTKRKDSL